MPIISEADQQHIRGLFETNLVGDVEILMFTERKSPLIIPGKQECETCDDTRALLEEVTALSDKLTLAVRDIAEAREEAAEHGISGVPAFVVKGASRGKVRFFGIPSGYEFSAFVDDLVDASKGTTTLSANTRDFLASLTEDVNIKVFTTPT